MELGQNSHGATGAPLQDPCASAASARERGHRRGAPGAVETRVNPGGSPLLEARTQSQSRNAGLGSFGRVRTQQPAQQLRVKSQSPVRRRVPPSPVRTPAPSSSPRVEGRANHKAQIDAWRNRERHCSSFAASPAGQAGAAAQRRQQQVALDDVRDVVEALQEAHDELRVAHDELRLVVQCEVVAREALVREVERRVCKRVRPTRPT